MEKIVEILERALEIREEYGLPVRETEDILKAMHQARITLPLIGKFSTGKSALLNRIIGMSERPVLKEDITPETAVPTELVYREEDSCLLIYRDGRREYIEVDRWIEGDYEKEGLETVEIGLRNDRLKQWKDIVLVDMPGFESDYEVHDRAIDSYVGRSLAYIVTFSADEMILTSSIKNILKELLLHEKKVCVAITKSDKMAEESIQQRLTYLKEKMAEVLPGNPPYCITSAREGEIEDLMDFLEEVQSSSQKILAQKFAVDAVRDLDGVRHYLQERIHSSELSESDLDGRIEKLDREMEKLILRIQKEKDSFTGKAEGIAAEIEADVQSAIQAEESALITMMENGMNIQDRIHHVARQAATKSMKEKFMPKFQKYIDEMTNHLSVDLMGEGFAVGNEENGSDKKALASATAVTITGIASAVAIGLPVIGTVAALVLGGISLAVNKIFSSSKAEERRGKIREYLRMQVYPSVMQQFGVKIRAVLSEKISEFNQIIDKELTEEKERIGKAIEDAKKERELEAEEKERNMAALNQDLEKIEVMMNELR